MNRHPKGGGQLPRTAVKRCRKKVCSNTKKYEQIHNPLNVHALHDVCMPSIACSKQAELCQAQDFFCLRMWQHLNLSILLLRTGYCRSCSGTAAGTKGRQPSYYAAAMLRYSRCCADDGRGKCLLISARNLLRSASKSRSIS